MKLFRWRIQVFITDRSSIAVELPQHLVARVIHRNRNKKCSSASLLGKLCAAIGDNFENGDPA